MLVRKELKKELNFKPHYTITDSIPILGMSEDSSLMEVNRRGLFSKTYKLQDINFRTAQRTEKGEIVKSYGGFLDALDTSQRLQITILNRLMPGEDVAAEQAYLPEIGDGLDDLRASYNDIIRRNTVIGQNNIRKEKYLTICQECSDIQSADKTFTQMEGELLKALEEIPGAGVTPLTQIERINLLYQLYNPTSTKEYAEYAYINGKKMQAFDISMMYKQGLSVRDLVAPESMIFDHSCFQLAPDVYGAALDLSGFPRSMRDTFINDLTNVDFQMILTLNIRQIEKSEAYRLVDHKLTNLENNYTDVLNTSGIPNHRLRHDEEEVNTLMDSITKKDQNLFTLQMHVVVFDKTREAVAEHVSKIQTMARSKGVGVRMAFALQEQSFNSSMPLGIDCTGIFRTLTTDNLSTLVPFSVQELQLHRDKNLMPVYYGTNQISKSLIAYDRFYADSYNGFILGTTGSGKSMTAKWTILGTYLSDPDADIFVIDPQGEYAPVIQALGGQVINVIGSGKQRINPFDIDVDYGDDGQDPVAAKIDFLISMVQIMVGLHSPLSSTQKAAIVYAGKQIYEPWIRGGKTLDLIPTMDDFLNAIASRDDSNHMDIYSLISTIGMYSKRAGVDVIFSDQTNVDINNRLICWDIQNLGESLKPLAMLIVLDMIWVRTCHNKILKKRTYLYIDEMHLLFRNENVAAFLRKLWKTIRKFNGAPTGITQNIEEIIKSEEGRAILNNTEFLILLKQSEMDRDTLSNLFSFSKEQSDFLRKAGGGKGLIRVNSCANLPITTVIPFENPIPKDNPIFDLISTKVLKDEED